MMNASIRDVAKRAGVSMGTASNAINKPEILAPETLKRVRKAIAELGFVPNASARTLRAGKTRILGLVVPDIANPFFTEVAKGVNDAALKAGYVVILCNTDESSEKEDQYLDVLTSQNVQGILITPARTTNKALSSITDRGIGLALVDRPALGIEACSVAVNDAIGGELALRHLVEGGHRKILLLTGAKSIPQVAEREKGILAAIANTPRSDRPTLQTLRVNAMTAQSADQQLTALLNEKNFTFTGIICGNDLIALGAIRALRNLNYGVPEEVSVIGYDDIDFAVSAHVPLTSISQPKYQLGYAAAELVISECEDPSKHIHQRVEFQPQLVIRQSTRSIANVKKV